MANKKNPTLVTAAAKAPLPKEGTRLKGWRPVLVLVALMCVVALVFCILWGGGQWFDGRPPLDTPNFLNRALPQVAAGALEPEAGGDTYNRQVDIQFTAEDIQRLDTMLAAWAATSNEPVEEGEAQRGYRVSVYFKDLDSGLEYYYNPDQKYFIASLNKAPYALYILDLIEKGEASLDETFFVTYAAIESSLENSGEIKNDTTLPRDYTIRELLYYLLRYSDTAAMRILLARYPADGYKAFLDEQGFTYPEDYQSVMGGRITARDTAVYLEMMYHYMAHGEYKDLYKEDLTNVAFSMIRSQHTVAHKYGWDEGAYHDMAVVYAPHPYYLAILTDKSTGVGSDYAMLRTIAETFEEMMAAKWDAYDGRTPQAG